ncbi:hypothetical protein, conserved [Babesia bigemina]|uniref:OTU domain-containing protein n=1 Tax=Babesia bigemina TaxID=5866 RepID=A0A061D9S8_BABBI|nr:hypothetical protein, conserved [Babesia bigemina]CDR96727.1 hypothetical protein, conserved [Babesia bigemina]|eukprot:XP_012768913.1 hypothetical protein, conserved [Babesia bigemina]
MNTSLVALAFAALAASAAADRWNPSTVEEYLNAEDKGQADRDHTQTLLSHVHSIDLNSLARMFYLWRVAQPKVCQRPELLDGWYFEDRWTTLQERFNFYGLAYALKEVPGDGRCLFHTIATALRSEKVTAKMLMRFLNPEASPHIVAVIKACETENGFYNTEALKKISLANMMGIYADDPVSIANFDEKEFAEKLEAQAEMQYNTRVMDDQEIMSLFKNVNLTDINDRLKKGENALELAKEVYNKIKPQHDEIFGSWIDINVLEELFMFRLVKLQEHDASIALSLGMDHPINFIILTRYTDGCHFKPAGLVDVCGSSDKSPQLPRSVIMPGDVPLPLAIMMKDS